MTKILVTDPVLTGMVNMLKEALPEYVDKLEFVFTDGTEADILANVQGCEIMLSARNKISAAVFEKSDKLFYNQQVSAGFDNIALEAATAKGVKVCNSAGSGVIAVAEHTLMLMMAITKKVVFCHNATVQKRWVHDEIHRKVGELHQKTLGIIGLGRIGKELARLASIFDMTVLASVRTKPDPSTLGNVEIVPQDELLKRSDFVVLLCSLNDQTRGLIGARELGLMKESAFLINTSRGEVVNTEALVNALTSGKINGAALDVLPSEFEETSKIADNNPVVNKLFTLDNVIITPHSAGITAENVKRTFDIAFNNVVQVIKGGEPKHVVNGVK